MESDAWLMQRLQRGDEAALAGLIDRYRARLFGFLRRRTADEAGAEDLFQETWLRVVRARASYDPRRRFSTWMFQIANNLCRDRARRRAVEQAGREALRPAAAGGPAARLDARLDAEALLARLPERLREVLVLRYFHQLREREIAEIAGIPVGTVKSRLHAALGALRDLYAGDAAVPGAASQKGDSDRVQ